MLKAGPAGYSESPAFRRTKRDRGGPKGSRERARGVYQTHQATGGPSVLVVGLSKGFVYKIHRVFWPALELHGWVPEHAARRPEHDQQPCEWSHAPTAVCFSAQHVER